MIKSSENLSEDIRIEMLKNKINKVQLSKKLNLSYPTILRKLEYPHTFSIEIFETMCEILSVSVKELLIKNN